MNKTFLSVIALLAYTTSCAKDEPPTPHDGIKTIDLSSYELIFADEFDGKKPNWNIWEADNPSNVKHNTSRGPEAISVRDGELRLAVRKVKRAPNIDWLAGYIFLKQPLENNVYIECRFKAGACTGVNNAFWLACKTPPNNSWQNRYEIDIVETRQNGQTKMGSAHLAWHDWKTYAYTTTESGKKFDIAQGIHVDHSFDQYHVWGLWYGEDELIYYLDGIEMWRGRTHKQYNDQYFTGVGKSPVWKPNEEARAYGRFGQDDWSYQGGYNGDKMHIILANIPWGANWSPLIESQADGSYMAVDYVRVYKPQRMLNTKPCVDIEKYQQRIVLPQKLSLAKDDTYYFSMVVNKHVGEEIVMNLCDESSNAIAKIIIDPKGYLLTGITKLTSNEFAISPFQGQKMVADSKPTLIVIRITAKYAQAKYDKDAISVCAFPVDPKVKITEPYFYSNVDDYGNTSQTQGWHINQKGFSNETISAIELTSTLGKEQSVTHVRVGNAFNAVVGNLK